MLYELTEMCQSIATDLLVDLKSGKIEVIGIDVVRERLRGLEAWNAIDRYDREEMEVYTLRRIVNAT